MGGRTQNFAKKSWSGTHNTRTRNIVMGKMEYKTKSGETLTEGDQVEGLLDCSAPHKATGMVPQRIVGTLEFNEVSGTLAVFDGRIYFPINNVKNLRKVINEREVGEA
jgi:hypothetical protein